METVRRVIAVVWVVVPPLLLSAIIHTIDPDVGGARGLVTGSTLLSVVLYGSVVAGFAYACLAVAIRFGWRWFAVTCGSLAVLVGLALTLAQSRPATPGGDVLPMLGCTIVVGLFLTAAVVPALALGWPRASHHESPET